MKVAAMGSPTAIAKIYADGMLGIDERNGRTKGRKEGRKDERRCLLFLEAELGREQAEFQAEQMRLKTAVSGVATKEATIKETLRYTTSSLDLFFFLITLLYGNPLPFLFSSHLAVPFHVNASKLERRAGKVSSHPRDH
jgi:hypothetical protein